MRIFLIPNLEIRIKKVLYCIATWYFAAENCCMLFILLISSTRNRDSIEEPIANYIYSKRILKDT